MIDANEKCYHAVTPGVNIVFDRKKRKISMYHGSFGGLSQDEKFVDFKDREAANFKKLLFSDGKSTFDYWNGAEFKDIAEFVTFCKLIAAIIHQPPGPVCRVAVEEDDERKFICKLV